MKSLPRLKRAAYIASRTAGTVRRLALSSACRLADACCADRDRQTLPASNVLVVGSERSGTTWLANMLASALSAQVVFEPFSPMAHSSILYHFAPESDRYHPAQRLSRLYIRPECSRHREDDLLERILSGRYHNYWSSILVDRPFAKRFVIKAVHANLMVGYLARRFQIPVVSIVRHPCAVVNSRQQGFGGQFRPDAIQRMLEQQELVQDWLTEHVAEMATVRGASLRHAVEWAVENSVMARTLHGAMHYNINYETLVQKPQRVLHSVLNWLGSDAPPVAVDFERPTHTSYMVHQKASDRLWSWQRDMSPSLIAEVLNWSRRFGIEQCSEHRFISGA